MARIDVVLHPIPATADAVRLLLGEEPAIRLSPPLPHTQLIKEMRVATLILSDSGGVQEEAPALGVPLLILHKRTERPEGIASGNMRLVGSETQAIIE